MLLFALFKEYLAIHLKNSKLKNCKFKEETHLQEPNIANIINNFTKQKQNALDVYTTSKALIIFISVNISTYCKNIIERQRKKFELIFQVQQVTVQNKEQRRACVRYLEEEVSVPSNDAANRHKHYPHSNNSMCSSTQPRPNAARPMPSRSTAPDCTECSAAYISSAKRTASDGNPRHRRLQDA